MGGVNVRGSGTLECEASVVAVMVAMDSHDHTTGTQHSTSNHRISVSEYHMRLILLCRSDQGVVLAITLDAEFGSRDETCIDGTIK